MNIKKKVVAPKKAALLVDSILVEEIQIVFRRWDSIIVEGILNVKSTLVYVLEEGVLVAPALEIRPCYNHMIVSERVLSVGVGVIKLLLFTSLIA